MQRAAMAGVSGLMNCGSCEEDWKLLPDIARRFPQVRLSFGLHPWYAGARTANWLAILETHLTDTPAAVGEIGLDHALAKTTFMDQESVLLAQIHLANKLKRPVTIHCRRAWGRLMALLDQKGWPAYGFVLHSYSGSAELVQPLLRRGACFSFSGAITFDQNRKGREAVTAVPLNCLLIETDAPDLPPKQQNDSTPNEAGVNEPARLVSVAQAVSALRGLSTGELTAITHQNAIALFS